MVVLKVQSTKINQINSLTKYCVANLLISKVLHNNFTKGI